MENFNQNKIEKLLPIGDPIVFGEPTVEEIKGRVKFLLLKNKETGSFDLFCGHVDQHPDLGKYINFDDYEFIGAGMVHYDDTEYTDDDKVIYDNDFKTEYVQFDQWNSYSLGVVTPQEYRRGIIEKFEVFYKDLIK